MSTTTRAVLGGLAIGLLMCLLSLFTSGGGHGWNTPLFFSPAGLIFYPIVLAGRVDHDGREAVWFPIIAALVLDAGLLAMTILEDFQSIERVVGRAAIWLALWFGWQGIALANLVRSRRGGH